MPRKLLLKKGRKSSPPKQPPVPPRRTQVHIRWQIRRDLPEVLAIEEASFEYPWSQEDFVRCSAQANCLILVAELREQVVGFMAYSMHRARLQLLNFAIHPGFRRQRVGEQLFGKLVSNLHRRRKILLEVRETNLTAQLFFREMGCRAISVLRDFYEETREDAYLFRYRQAAPRDAAA